MWHMNRNKVILVLIFIIALSFRLYFAFQTSNFDYDAYFSIRQINEIQETGKPIYADPLSYGGRTLVFLPFFYYIMAFLEPLIPFALKIIPNIFAASLVFLVYLISKQMTKNAKISLITAFASSFIPIFIQKTVNSISVYSLAIPLIFLILYLIMSGSKRLLLFIALCFLISITHPISFLMILGLLIYLILVRLENINQEKSEFEMLLFTIFFILWLEFLVFKNPFLTHGTSVIWQNLPPEVLALYFGQANIIQAAFFIGIIPLFAGIYIIYRYLFKEKDKNIYLLMSFALAAAFLLLFRLIPLATGMAFLGIVSILLFAKYQEIFTIYAKKSKLPHLNLIILFFFIIFFITSIIPSYYFTEQQTLSTPSDNEIKALEWLKENSDANATILGTVEQGYLITAIAERKNVFDSDFLLIHNPEQIVQDVRRIYSTQSQTEAINLLNQYKIDYILLTDNAKETYNINELEYSENEECFVLVYNKKTKIYESKCRLERIN